MRFTCQPIGWAHASDAITVSSEEPWPGSQTSPLLLDGNHHQAIIFCPAQTSFAFPIKSCIANQPQQASSQQANIYVLNFKVLTTMSIF